MLIALSYWTIVSLLLGGLILIPAIMGLFGGNKFDVQGKTVLLTGASEGMGKSVAKKLAQKGADIIIVARNVGKLEGALAEIKASAKSPSTQRFKYISADLSEQDGAAAVLAEATTWNHGNTPDIVWCIAGSAYPGLFIETSTKKMREQMDINYWSCVDMAHATLKEWLAPSSIVNAPQRHLIFTSSVAAFYPVTGYAPYAPAKAAIKSLSDALAQEVLLYGGANAVKVHTIFPGTISSAGLEKENETKPKITHILEDSDPVQTPDAVAEKSIKGLENGEYLVTVNLLGQAMRACALGGSKRNNWVWDTLLTCITSLVWLFVGPDLDGKVKSYAKKHGHPSTYAKQA